MPASGTLSHTLLKVLHAALQRYTKSTDARSGVQRTLVVGTAVLWAVGRSLWLRLLKAGDSVNLLETKIKKQHLIWPERVAMEKALSEKQSTKGPWILPSTSNVNITVLKKKQLEIGTGEHI